MEWTVNDAEEKKMVAAGGLEPPRVLPQRILNPSCLPISPRRHRRVGGIILSQSPKATSRQAKITRRHSELESIEQGQLGNLCKRLLSGLQYEALETEVADGLGVIDIL